MSRARSGEADLQQPASAALSRPVAGLPNSTVARLARTEQGRRLLARWHSVTSAGYAVNSPGGAIGSPFTWQEEDISIQPRPGGAVGSGLQYLQHTPATPNLKVSGDNTIAMQETPGEAKEVYLDPQVRQNANVALAAKGSPIKLGKAGHTVTVPAYKAVAQNTLEKVRPKFLAGQPRAAQLNAQDFPPLATIICRDVAQSILGGKLTHIRLRDQAGTVQDVAANTDDANIVTGSQQLAKAVASRRLSLADAAAKMATAKVPVAGKAYGRATRKANFDDRALRLGINEHAWANAGEAYVIQSTYAKPGDTRNYSDPNEAPLTGGGFGYHFAAVVAEALDGRDAVTLENYRRSGEIESGAKQLLQQLRATFAAHLTNALANIGGFQLKPEEEIGAILEYVEAHAAPDFNRALAKWKQVVGELGNPGSLYFFRMVGRDNPNQSFHRQLAASGYFASPMTFVMAR